jgi:hypothetical protein
VQEFLCFPNDRDILARNVRSAYVVGVDGVPVRGEVRVTGRTIVCETRTSDPVGISLLWPAKGFGTVELQTTRLPPRPEPYHLHVELARHRLMRISIKREEWGLFDYSGMSEVAERIDQARDLFLASLEQTDDPPRAAELADESLLEALWASEEMSRFHATVFLSRRQQSGGFSRGFLGVTAPGSAAEPSVIGRIGGAFDFVRVPFVWRDIQPKETGARFDEIDAWVKACSKKKLAMRGGPLLNFGVRFVPDWMYLWENDYEAISDFARDHIRRTVERYKGKINNWVVASGLHADTVFPFTFEHIIDLTRMAAGITKQVAPRAHVSLDLTQPWGEYYARNQRTIPPLLYADMAVQSGINFDSFGLQFQFGIAADGFHLRDLLEISSLIDRLANLGKPLHVTAVGVPAAMEAKSRNGSECGGQWHEPWSDATQADWLSAFCEIALSKPYVESVCFHLLGEAPGNGIPNSGILAPGLEPRAALQRLRELRDLLRPEAG